MYMRGVGPTYLCSGNVMENYHRGERSNDRNRGRAIGKHLTLPGEHLVGVANTVHHHKSAAVVTCILHTYLLSNRKLLTIRRTYAYLVAHTILVLNCSTEPGEKWDKQFMFVK